MSKVAIAHVQVPFVSGGAEVLVSKLQSYIKSAGHQCDIVSVPFVDCSMKGVMQQADFWKRLSLSDADCVISTKFPSYYIEHPNHVCWLVHQHRQCYDLLGSSFGGIGGDHYDEAFRRLISEGDKEALSGLRGLYTISENVSRRLRTYLNLDSIPLEPPLPLVDRYRNEPSGGYILSVGRLCSIKRVDLLLKSAPFLDSDLGIVVAGAAAEEGIAEHYQSLIDKHHLQHRVKLVGRVSDDELLDYYARSHAVFYGPYDEDYGFVTLEAFKSGKPVITCSDSGGVLDFVRHEQNGLVCEPTPDSLAEGVNRIWRNRDLYDSLCRQTEVNTFTWDEVVSKLLSGP